MKKDIERKVISVQANQYGSVFSSYIPVDLAILNIQTILQLIPEENRKTATIECHFNNEEIEVDIFYQRLETDREWNKRLQEIDARELAERKEYERLKEKYS